MPPKLSPDGGDAVCARIAAARHGVITRAEAIEAGLSSQAIHRRTKSGLWTHPLPGIYVVGEGHSHWHQRLAALTEWCRGVASHASAAVLLELDGFQADSLEVSTVRNRPAPWPHVNIHRVTILPSDSATIAGIRTTSATRTLVDVAAGGDAERLELALEDALRRRLTSLPRLRWALSVEGGRGRPGARLLRGLVDRVESYKRVTESGFEARLQQLLRRADLPPPRRQFQIRDGGRFVARADFAFPESRLVIEAVSYRWHSGRNAWTRDQTRLNAVVALGWRVMNVTWEDLRDRPDETVDRIRRALGRPRLLE